MMRVWTWIVVACLGACSLDLSGELGAPIDGGSPASRDGGTFDATVDGPDTDSGDAENSFLPAHVPRESMRVGAGALSNVSLIDTDTLAIEYSDGSAPNLPAGSTFELVGTHAVLFVGTWTIDVPVRVIGSHPLIVVSTGDIFVDALIDAGARGPEPGPGGYPPGMGPGSGGDGSGDGNNDSGGGGAGHGIAGALGGPSAGALGGPSGIPYLGFGARLQGGSGGGAGSPSGACSAQSSDRIGGAGGGALELSSMTRVHVTPNGGVQGGGGGGGAGCTNSGGGGGGAGGVVWIEALVEVRIDGTLAANGGGGGGGGGIGSTSPGEDGVLGTAAAAGGDGSNDGNQGGGGGSLLAQPVSPMDVGATNNGGGGGGFGHVVLRSRATSPTISGAISPSPAITPIP